MDSAHYTLVNLRVLAKLKPGHRLQTVDSRYFGIDDSAWSWLYRWLRSDNRGNTVDRIEETFANAKKHNAPDALVNQAKCGVEKLCSTYVSDPTMVARLETIIDRRDSKLGTIQEENERNF